MEHDTEEEEMDLDELFSTVPYQLIGTISPETTEFFTSSTSQRSDKNIPKVLADLEDIEFFQKFPIATKKNLCKKMVLASYSDDEYLLRQGEDVQGMFVLLSGVVKFRYNILTPNSNDGAETQWPERVLIRGYYFGQADLLRRRSASVDAYTACHSELLLLKSEDFDIVRSQLKTEQLDLKRSIRSVELLSNFEFSEEELIALEMFCKKRSYLEEVEIYNGPSGAKPKWSYFLVKGECRLARDVSYCITDPGSSNMRYQAFRIGEIPRAKVLTTTLEFETVKQNFFFGVGEDFGRNRVFAMPSSELLLVTRLVLVFKNKKLLVQMADLMNRSLPPDQALLDTLLEHEKAADDVKDLVEDALGDKSKKFRKEKPNSSFRKL